MLDSTPRFEKFIFKNVFEKIKTKSIKYKAKDFPEHKTPECTLPLLTAGINNQGLARYAPSSICPTILNNVISISANGANTGATFYQPNDFAVLQDSYAVKVRNFTIPSQEVGLYLAACINKTIRNGRSWTNKAGYTNVSNDEVALPVLVDSAGEAVQDQECTYHEEGYIPDWEYMENYIRELEAERIRELEAYLQAAGLTDTTLTPAEKSALDGGATTTAEFLTSKFFTIEKTSSHNKEDLNISNDTYDYVTRSTMNRGIIETTGFIESDSLNEAHTFSLELMNLTPFYREKPWYAGQFVRKLIPTSHMVTKNFLYFEVHLLKLQKLLKSVLIRDVDKNFNESLLSLPIKVDHSEEPILDTECTYHEEGYIPDWEYMENYIRAIEKQTIERIMHEKDIIISTTKEICN
ncbi:MAG: restriction endonuclease subunit S [Actinomycetaceae bacterium]|nr:restriction endonuclease subunit S [Actinomycetaceae bacterium]